MAQTNGIAGFVVLVTKWGIPLVMELSKPLPHYWKIPGGAGEGRETPKQCARREFLEEVGGDELRVFENDLVLVKTEPVVNDQKPWKNHTRYFFRADCLEVEPKARGDEGETIEVFQPDQVLEMLQRGEILEGHREILRGILQSIGVAA